MASTELALDFSRTLDRLRWAPKVWRPERSSKGMGKSYSDPCFTSTCTRLPEVLHSTNVRKARSVAPKESQKKLAFSPTRRLLAGASTQVGFHNTESQPVLLPDINRAELGGAVSHKSRRASVHANLAPLDLVEQEKKFHETLDAVKTSMTGIHSSLEYFEGGGKNVHHRHTKKVKAPGEEDKEDKEEARKARVLLYRYVKKIEPEPVPLEPFIESEFDPSFDGRLIHENASLASMQVCTQQGKKLARAEMIETREHKMALAKANRLLEDHRRTKAGIEKRKQFQERMARFGQTKDVLSTVSGDAASAPAREKQVRHWQSALAMLGFFQICSNVVKRYKEVKTGYNDWLLAENLLPADATHDHALAVFTGEHLMANKFLDQARIHIHSEWSIRPQKLQATWKVAIAKDPHSKEKGGMLDKPISKNDPRSPVSLEKRREGRAFIYVDLPNPDNLLRCKRNATLLEAMLVGKIHRKRSKKQAARIVDCLGHWRLQARFFIRMLERVKRCKRIQRFFRWALHNMHENRMKLEAEWIRLESSMVPLQADTLRRRGTKVEGSGGSTSVFFDEGPQPLVSRSTRTQSWDQADGSHASHPKIIGHNGHSGSHGDLHKLAKSGELEDCPHKRRGHTHATFAPGVHDGHGSHHGSSYGSIGGHGHHGHHGEAGHHGHGPHAHGHHAHHAHGHKPHGPGHAHHNSSGTHNDPNHPAPAPPRPSLDAWRRKALILALRKKRKRHLPAHDFWMSEMALYWRYVAEWREHLATCKKNGTKPFIEMPDCPGCPSHLPSEEELIEIIKQFRTKKVVPKASIQLKSGPQGRVARLAEEANPDAKKLTTLQDLVSSNRCGSADASPLCDEVSDMLSPTAAHPVPVGDLRVHRPLCPSPV